MKFVPATVIVNAVLPAITLAGEREEMDGTGLVVPPVPGSIVDDFVQEKAEMNNKAVVNILIYLITNLV